MSHFAAIYRWLTPLNRLGLPTLSHQDLSPDILENYKVRTLCLLKLLSIIQLSIEISSLLTFKLLIAIIYK